MNTKPTKLERPDIHLDAILSLVGILLGFLFIVVIYILENPLEFLSTWGMPLIMFLIICYALGLTIIGFIISYEINFYLANKLLKVEPAKFPSAKFSELQHTLQRSLRQTIQMLLYFIFSFGLFLINLASFTASKLFYPSFALIENNMLILWGPIILILIRLLVMFLVQFILII
ncbi:MAG: hypothetical protein ACFFDP_12555, partial [Promethearchaeota archaeon]